MKRKGNTGLTAGSLPARLGQGNMSTSGLIGYALAGNSHCGELEPKLKFGIALGISDMRFL